MGKLIFQRTLKPYKVSIYDNDDHTQISFSAITQFEDGSLKVRLFYVPENEFTLFYNLICDIKNFLDGK